jgi:TRAP-type C4-dicarboxylate transport system permease small subunit
MSLFDRILKATITVACALIIGLMICQISLDAAFRTVFSAPLPATIEVVSNYYMVALSFLPIALVQRQGRNIEASFVYDGLPRPFQKLADGLTRLLSLGIYSVLAWQTGLDALTKTRINAYVVAGTTELPIWPCYWILPVSFGLLVIALAVPSSLSSIAGASGKRAA